MGILAVSLDEKIRATVGIETTGTSLAVKDFNAVLVTGLSQLQVEALPGDLPERLVVDLSTLLKIGDAIHVSDIQVSDKVQVLDSPDELVVIATAPKVEIIEEPVAVAEVEGEEPEMSVERGKKEEGAEAESEEEDE